MMVKIAAIICFVLAVLVFGCQEQILSNSAGKVKRDTAKDNIQANQNMLVSDAVKTSAEQGNDAAVIVYYFHRTIRCPACLTIEANAARIIEENFSRQIADGRLIWLPLNLDDPDSKEFEKEFDISGSTLLLAKTTGGNHREFRKLEKVWDLNSDPVKFDTYIQDEVRRFLNE